MLPNNNKNSHLVAVIGAGPAGLYAAQYLARNGIQVVLFNRDIKPGGLAEYGIFPDKHKMRAGLSAQFHRILALPEVTYRGNVRVGQSGEIHLDHLRQAGFQAIMVTTGAQLNNWLGLPGEDLEGIYHANNLVFYYNHLPSYSSTAPRIGRRAAIIGVGNVMLDIVHYLKLKPIERQVTAYARRGPTEIKFDPQTLAPVADCLDLTAIEKAVGLARPAAQKVGADVTDFFEVVRNAQEKAEPCDEHLTFDFCFLRSPRRLIGDHSGRVKEILFEINDLFLEDGRIVSRGTGSYETVRADTVIFSIGSRVDESFGLPVAHGNFVTTPEPRFPVDDISYEVYNPELCASCEDVFVSGWARKASEGIVGLARKDAERGARAVMQYLQTQPTIDVHAAERALRMLPKLDHPVVDLDALDLLEAAEQKKAAEMGLPSYKFSSDEAMLRVIRDQPSSS
jgi:ferredoxin--NADP+ reductase